MNQVPETTLLVIRHGETEWNARNLFQGHGDSPLTGRGRAQARAAGRRLKRIRFDHLISSDLGRARQTAALIAGQTGHVIETDARLRERHYGVLEGLNLAEIQSRFADVLARLSAGDPEYIIPGGESHGQHYRRNIAFFQGYLAERPGTTALIVAHGGVLDSLFRFVAGLPLDQPRCFLTANAGLSVLRHGNFHGDRRWVLERWGDAGHLEVDHLTAGNG